MDYIDCLWLRWSHFAFLYSAEISDCNKMSQDIILCGYCYSNIVIILLLDVLQWYSFRCVVNIDLGIDMRTQGVWKSSSGPHRSGIRADVDLVTWP